MIWLGLIIFIIVVPTWWLTMYFENKSASRCTTCSCNHNCISLCEEDNSGEYYE